MVYIELKEKNGKKYYYRTHSLRKGKKVSKKRVYLGADLSLQQLERERNNIVQLQKERGKKAIAKLKPIILKILKKYHIPKAGVFGSYARGEQRKNSDIDIIVQPPKGGIGLFDFVGVKLDLEERLKKNVDLLTYASIHPLLKERILNEEVRIL
ncbi:MAG: nucleotidyltransferase family protein [Nanoarchaeota archaeon]